MAENLVLRQIAEMKKHPVFRKARFDVSKLSSDPEGVIVLLGQVHTVWRGKIGNRERNMIVHCQARLCSYYAYFESVHGIREFGGEGLFEGLETSFADQACFQLYRSILEKLQIQLPVTIDALPSVSKKIFSELGKEWHDALREKNMGKIQLFASAVSGMTLFNFLNDENINVFPVEGESAYQSVLAGVNVLGQRIEKLDQTTEMRSIRQRGGKVQSEKELEVLKQYNAVVREFNRIIGSDLRERATLQLMKQKVEKNPMVLFTMGIGHRKNYLQLVIKTNAVFVPDNSFLTSCR